MDALGDPTRRAIIDRLLGGPMPVGELARDLATPADLEERASGRRPPRGQPTALRAGSGRRRRTARVLRSVLDSRACCFQESGGTARPQGGAMTSVTEAVVR